MAGFSGFACGGVQLGVRGDECLVRLSGDVARVHWGRAYALSENVTRVDLQLTYQLDHDTRSAIRAFHKSALRHSRLRARGPSVTLITGSDGSDTLYLGKRTSNSYGRIYAKGIESKDPAFANCVRSEVEYKAELAAQVLRSVARAKKPYEQIRGSVYGFFLNRGCALPGITNACVYRQPRERTDLDQRLEWIAKAVRPSAQMAVQFGRSIELLEALGLCINDAGDLIESPTFHNHLEKGK